MEFARFAAAENWLGFIRSFCEAATVNEGIHSSNWTHCRAAVELLRAGLAGSAAGVLV